jgi:hypothetical protein
MEDIELTKEELKKAVIKELKPYIIKQIKIEFDKKEKEERIKDLYGLSYL